jgi:hypothetical protein
MGGGGGEDDEEGFTHPVTTKATDMATKKAACERRYLERRAEGWRRVKKKWERR